MSWRQRILRICLALSVMVRLNGLNALSCKEDNDCPKNQYCYLKSNCVFYTNCTAMFNREEGSTPARDAHQCGDCIKGFFEEEYITNERPDKCKPKTELTEVKNDTIFYLKILIPIVGFGLLAVGLTCWFYWKKKISNSSNGHSTHTNQCVDNNRTTLEDRQAVSIENTDMLIPIPSAPLDENSPHGEDQAQYHFPRVHVKRKSQQGCIEFQCARVCVPPFYVSHANYGMNVVHHSVDDTDASPQEIVSLTSNNNNESPTYSTTGNISMESEANAGKENSDNTRDSGRSFSKKNIVVQQTNYLSLSV